MIRRLADVILDKSLPGGVSGEVLRKDLARELEDPQARAPGRFPGLWYLWEALKMAAHFSFYRLRNRGPSSSIETRGSGRGDGFMGSLAQDLRFATRTLQRRWVFAAVAVVTLGLGVGSATAMFSVVDGVLLQSVPFEDPDRLVNVWRTSEGAQGIPGVGGPDLGPTALSLVEYRAWQEATSTFEAVAIHNGVEITLTGRGPAERVARGVGSASLLSVMGVDPILGRWFLPEEEGVGEGPAAMVTVVSFGTWTNRLGSDPDVLGTTLTLGGEGYTVVGVLPEGFRLRHLGMHWLGEDRRGVRDVWTPVSVQVLGNGNNLEAIGRLAPGVTVEAAMSETRHIFEAVGSEGTVRIVPRAEDEIHGLESPLLLLLAATGILLLIACANVATLALGELHGRGPELSTRAALGAGKRRIIRQLLTESVLLGVAGTVLGTALAFGGTRLLVAMAPPLPRVETVGVDLRVLAFAALAGTLASVLFGTLPAFVSAGRTAAGMGGTTRTASARRGGFERWLVSFEIALTVVLLVAGGLLGRSFRQLISVDPGFEPEGLATVSVFLSQGGYGSDGELVTAYDELARMVGDIPGVMQATAISRLPFPGLTNTNSLQFPGRDGGEDFYISVQQLYALPNYHEVMGIPIVAGGGLPDSRAEGAPMGLLLTENVAREYWPQGDPIGIGLRRWGGDAVVVGLVGDVKRNALGVEADQAYFVSLRDQPKRAISLLARTQGDARALAARMQQAVRDFDPDIPVRQVSTMPDLIYESTAQERYRTFLMGVFGVLATILAAVGIFGVTARGVAQRTKEMGVRMCLGAEQGKLLAMVVRDGLITGLLGTLAGFVLAGGVGRLLSGFLFGVESLDLLTYTSVAAFLLLVVVLSSYLPARRLGRLDPARVLRAE